MGLSNTDSGIEKAKNNAIEYYKKYLPLLEMIGWSQFKLFCMLKFKQDNFIEFSEKEKIDFYVICDNIRRKLS